MELKDLLAFSTLLTLLCPGLVFVYVQNLVVVGRGPEISKDNLASFVAVSAAYTVFCWATGLVPAFLFEKKIELLADAPIAVRAKVVVFAFIAPAILAGAYAAARQRDLPYRVMLSLGLSPVDPSPSAWVTAVKRITQGDFVIATLKDGRTIAGNIDHLACFANEKDGNDMLLSETDPPPSQNADVIRSTWIAAGEIQTLEIVTRRAPSASEYAEPRLFFRRIQEQR